MNSACEVDEQDEDADMAVVVQHTAGLVKSALRDSAGGRQRERESWRGGQPTEFSSSCLSRSTARCRERSRARTEEKSKISKGGVCTKFVLIMKWTPGTLCAAVVVTIVLVMGCGVLIVYLRLSEETINQKMEP